VKEQSHKDEMTAALRGDFERLRERGVSNTLAPVESLAAEEPIEQSEPERESGGEALAAQPPEPLADEPPAPATQAVHDAEPEPEPRQGWLDRLLGR
jgi:hypothetical protein